MKIITVTRIREMLKSITFNPKKDPAMKIISESLSPEYYEDRAIELIREAQNLRYSKEYNQKMIMAQRLLCLARYHGGESGGTKED